MTKTLTEQWKDGELPEGEYFAITTWSDEIRPLSFYGDCFLDTEVPLDNSVIVEVLAPVPSYDEYKNLEDVGNELLMQNAKLEQQLKEANEVITMPEDIMYHDELVEKRENYLKKWGVK